MPEYWQFATVSMGLGPIMAIYQARFMHYLNDRKIASSKSKKVWPKWAETILRRWWENLTVRMPAARRSAVPGLVGDESKGGCNRT